MGKMSRAKDFKRHPKTAKQVKNEKAAAKRSSTVTINSQWNMGQKQSENKLNLL